MSARWVPCLLTQEQKRVCPHVCESLLAHYVTYKTWVHHYPRIKTSKCGVAVGRGIYTGKGQNILATISRGFAGILLIDFPHSAALTWKRLKKFYWMALEHPPTVQIYYLATTICLDHLKKLWRPTL